MKVTVTVDCTPEEARTFLGLPDVAPVQAAVMADLQERLTANLHAMDPDSLFRSWMPMQVQNLGTLQDLFWSQMARAASAAAGTTGGGAAGGGTGG